MFENKKKLFDNVFFVGLAFSAVAPYVTFLTLFSSFNIGDVLLCFVIITYLLRFNFKITFHKIFLLPILLLFISLISMLIGVTTSDFYENPKIFFILRWFYYITLMIFVCSYCNCKERIFFVILALYVGLIITMAITWAEWSFTPNYFGSIPRLHTVHHFKHFELNRNYVGFFMGIGTSLSFAYFYLSKNKIKRLIHLSIFVLFAFSAFATLSKGAWLSAFLFITLFLLYRLFVKFDHKMVGWAFLSMPIIIALIYSGIINLTTIVGAVDDRVNNSQETIGERSEYIQDAIEIISHHPLLGVGSGGYRDAANFYRLNDTSDPHNAFLWFFSELGVGGFLIMLILTVYVFIYLINNSKSSLGFLIMFVFIPIIINTAITGLPFTMKYFWSVIGLVSSINILHINSNRGKGVQ